MTILETVEGAIENVANFQNSIDDAKDIMKNIEHNNPIVGDLEGSIGSIEGVVKAIQTKDVASIIDNGMDLGNELVKIPGDIKKFIDEKGGSLLKDGTDIKDEVIGLVTKIGDQFKEIVGDLKEGNLKGFIDAFKALTTAISEDIASGKEISGKIEHIVNTLESNGNEVKVQAEAEQIASGMKDVSGVKEADGKDGQQSPTTPGQDVSQDQEVGM